MVIRIRSEITWNVARLESGSYVAECPGLSVVVAGETWSEVAQAANDSVAFVLGTFLRENSLDRFLAAHGWEREGVAIDANADDVRFDVPVHLVLQRNHDDEPRPHR